jgi:hypothetical protein
MVRLCMDEILILHGRVHVSSWRSHRLMLPLACSYNLLMSFPGFCFFNLIYLVVVCCFSGVYLEGYKGLVPSFDLSAYILSVFAVFQHCYFWSIIYSYIWPKKKTATGNSYKILRVIQRSDQKLWPFRTGTLVGAMKPSPQRFHIYSKENYVRKFL